MCSYCRSRLGLDPRGMTISFPRSFVTYALVRSMPQRCPGMRAPVERVRASRWSARRGHRPGRRAGTGRVGFGPETRPSFRHAREGERLVSPDPIFPSPLMDDDPDTQLEIQTWRLDSLRVVRLLGELDTLTTPRVRVQLDEVLLTFDALTLIMDLTRLTFMGSTGINVLLETRDRVAERSGRLIVVLAPESNPRRLFEVTRMTDHFEVAENLEDTVRVLRQQGPDQAAWGVADEMS
ncbi:hypothetical protein DKM19_28925 [Streptosporangium sp. 'caverna']|nr:hypothetical protein DKM19_28925 [Streptosporangium sp. 'caverna']